MRLPKKPQSLKDLPEFCNAVIEYLRMVKIGNVVGGRVSQTTSGTTITINPPPTTGSEVTPTSEFTHPWKVTPNGTAFVTVAPGNVTGFLPKSDTLTPAWKPRFFPPFVGTYIKFPGDVVEVTESSGYIYMGFTLESEVEGIEGAGSGGGDLIGNIYRPYTEPVVFFYDLSPENLDSTNFFSAYDVIIPIAEVSLADDIASVDYQILTHNPMIQLDDIEYPYEPE
jgi:hypothetical protein